MRPNTTRLLMVLIGTMLSACASQTERGSAGSSTAKTPKALAYEPAPYVEPPPRRAEPATAPPEPAAPAPKAAPTPPQESVPEFVAEAEPADMVPVPSSDSFAAEAEERTISEPVMPHDEEETAPPEEGIVAQNQYYEEEERPAQDDGIVAQNQYYDEEVTETDDGIVAHNQYYDEEVTETDDGIVAHNEYYDEEVTETDDGIVAQNQYFEEEGKEPAELIGEPKTYPEETVVAAAEEKQPEPAPKKEPPKPVVLPITVTLETEALFDFDRSAVRPDGRDKLDKLAGGMQGVQYDAILVVGHADRIGTTTYNQRLSERRAEAVKQYLVSKGLPANKIKAEGRGELDPAQDASACKGLRKQKLIACLQPDRRVDVTVTGQKQAK